MGSLSSNKIPVINFSIPDLKPGSPSWSKVRAQVLAAVEEYGMFEAAFGESKLQIHQAMLDALKELLDLPAETRAKHPANDRYNGRPNPHTPLYGNMGLHDVQDLDRLQAFTTLMWPQGNTKFCEAVHSYVTLGAEMERMVKRMIFESFGVEKYYDSYVESTSFFLRINRYRTPKANETNLGLNEHTDSSFISVLSQNEVNGLQTKTRDGEWIPVTPAASSFVVLIGDACMAWSNGRLYSPPHKVVMYGDSVRYSIALFAFIKGRLIETPEELVDNKHPLSFKPFDHIGYRQFLTSDEGKKVESAIRAYCAV